MRYHNTPFQLLFFGLLMLGIVYSCSTSEKESKTTATDSASIHFDSIEKVLIDTMMANINELVRQKGAPTKLSYPLHNPKDSLQYWILPDRSARISMEWNPQNEIIWPTFFVYNGDLVMVRYRHMKDSPPDSEASETMIYLKNGKIIYCEERGRKLLEGEYPGLIRRLPYSKSTRSYTEIEKDYKEYWGSVKAHMKENGVLPDFLEI